MTRTGRHSAIILLLLCLFVGGTASCRRQAAPAEDADAESTLATPVVAVAVQVGPIRTVVRASGMITAPPDAEFLATTTESGTVLEARAAGEMVATGDVLVRLDIPAATQNVTRQQAEVASNQAAVESAQVVVTRNRDLVSRGLIARRDLEVSEQELVEAQTGVQRAQALLTAARAAAGRAFIRAPFPGMVVMRFHNPGDVLSGISSDPILRFVDTSRLEVTAAVKAEDAARFAVGATARLATIADGQPVTLTVAGRAPAPGSADSLVRLTFNAMPMLPVETAVQVDIDAEERTTATFVPGDAVVREEARTYVYVAAGNRAERRSVTLGVQDETRTEILMGVQRGELVIVQGHVGLPDGAPITVDATR